MNQVLDGALIGEPAGFSLGEHALHHLHGANGLGLHFVRIQDDLLRLGDLHQHQLPLELGFCSGAHLFPQRIHIHLPGFEVQVDVLVLLRQAAVKLLDGAVNLLFQHLRRVLDGGDIDHLFEHFFIVFFVVLIASLGVQVIAHPLVKLFEGAEFARCLGEIVVQLGQKTGLNLFHLDLELGLHPAQRFELAFLRKGVGESLLIACRHADHLAGEARKRPFGGGVGGFSFHDHRHGALAHERRVLAFGRLGALSAQADVDHIAFLNGPVGGLKHRLALAQLLDGLLNRILRDGFVLVRDTDRAIITQLNLGSQGHQELKLRRFDALDVLQRTGAVRLDAGLLDCLGVDIVHQDLGGLFQDGAFANLAQDHRIGRFSRAEAGDLYLAGQFAGGSLLGVFHG